jgi:hypothetical protein
MPDGTLAGALLGKDGAPGERRSRNAASNIVSLFIVSLLSMKRREHKKLLF